MLLPHLVCNERGRKDVLGKVARVHEIEERLYCLERECRALKPVNVDGVCSWKDDSVPSVMQRLKHPLTDADE
jgi:hypothetical protein